MNVPPLRRANRKLKSAARAVPMCSGPVGLGAMRTRIGRSASVVIGSIVGGAIDDFAFGLERVLDGIERFVTERAQVPAGGRSAWTSARTAGC